MLNDIRLGLALQVCRFAKREIEYTWVVCFDTLTADEMCKTLMDHPVLLHDVDISVLRDVFGDEFHDFDRLPRLPGHDQVSQDDSPLERPRMMRSLLLCSFLLVSVLILPSHTLARPLASSTRSPTWRCISLMASRALSG